MPQREGEVVKFDVNVPVQVALAYGSGKEITTKFGKRVMFTLVGGACMFLDLNVAKMIEDLPAKPRQPFWIVKHRDGKTGSLDHWRVWEGPEIGEQPDGTFVVGATVASVAPSTASTGTNTPNGNGSTNGHGRVPPIPPGWGQLTLERAVGLVDVYVAVKKYAAPYGLGPEDVRALVAIAYQGGAK